MKKITLYLNLVGSCGKCLAVILAGLMMIACQSDDDVTPAAADQWQKIDAQGEPATDSEHLAHACVLDHRTGLMWEVKQQASGPWRTDATYSWYEPDDQRNMSDAGLVDGGLCDLGSCDTHHLVLAVNEQGLCGHHDWTLPTREQLLTLGDRSLIDKGLVLDRAFFPNDLPGEYWSASTFRLYPQSAWLVDSSHGLDRAERKHEARYARLVRRHFQVEK